MDDLDTREWLLTNGLGGFACGTVCDARTRTYHGWLIAALDSLDRRTLLFSHLEASLELSGQVFALGTNFWTGDKVDPWGYQLLQSFDPVPVATWVWGTEQWELSRQIVLPKGLDEQRILIRYIYQGSQTATLRLRPLIGDRDFHHPQQQQPGVSFSQIVHPHHLLLQSLQFGKAGILWQIRWSQGHYQPDETWYWSYYYPEEANRGLNCMEDLYSPGYLTVLIQPGDSLTLEASVGFATPNMAILDRHCFTQAVAAKKQSLDSSVAWFQASNNHQRTWEKLLQTRDLFMIQQVTTGEPLLIAGYPWFGDRSRDTLLCIPGFALAIEDYPLARQLLQRLGCFCCQGLIPNQIPGAGEDPFLSNIDCALWWIETLGLYLEATQDWEFLAEQYAVVKQIYKAFTAGSLYSIRVDAADGLITWDDGNVALTWMDAIVDGVPVTPRHGKPVEINALWYSALCWAGEWAGKLAITPELLQGDVAQQSYLADRLQNQVRRYTEQAQQVKQALQKFWNPTQGYLYDRIEPDDRLDPTIRPNAVLALSLHHCAFASEQAQKVLQVARDCLLTPYGLRTLDAANSAYQGHYTGDPHQRDLAAHQGTVWSWLLGPFIRAWLRFDPTTPLPLDLQPLLTHFNQEVSFGNISELFDGDSPHQPRGAIAHASPVAELLRVWNHLQPS